MLHYILQIVFFQLCFLLAYELLLKKETFFNYNRWYLLLTPVLALLLPLLKLEFLTEAVPANARIMLPAVVIGDQTGTMEPLPGAVSTEEGLIINWWLIIYSLGFVASFGLFLKKFYNLNRLFRFRKTSEEKGFRIIEIPNSNIACTFFNTVFLGHQLSKEEKRQILSHELVHVKQKHSLDLMFFELLKIIFWFNPLIYIYQSRIAGLHEFIADQEVVKTTGKKTYYEQLLNTAFSTQNISFINQFFNHSLIKKRILMLQKSKSKAVAKFRFLVLIPLMMLMLIYVACSENEIERIGSEESVAEGSAKEAEEVFPAGFVYPGCEGLKSVEERNACMYEKIRKRVREAKEALRKKNDPFVSYALIDEAPAFPGCEDIASKEEKKQCTHQRITEFVYKNFDAGLSKKMVDVTFKIDKNGKIQNVETTPAVPELEEEARRVINSLPAMKPGKQNGEPIDVMYGLQFKRT